MVNEIAIFDIKKIFKNFSAVFFSSYIFGHQNAGSGSTTLALDKFAQS
jgi:hypothetical protein